MEEKDMLEEEIPVADDNIADADFDYDDEGNIIIPDDSEDFSETEYDNGEVGEEESEEEVPESEESAPEAKAVPDERDARIAELEKLIKEYELQGKDTLAKLGVKTDNVMDGLIRLAAEAEEKTPEEYRKMREENIRVEEAKQLLQNMEYEQQAKKDLEELQAIFPETKSYKSVREIPNLAKYAKFRDIGLSAEEAYSAANPREIRKSVVNATKRQSQNDSKAHLRSVVPKGSKDSTGYIPKDQLNMMRSAFPGKSDKEIYAIYKKVK